jgi:phosphoadenosine phosphosulfate reductase
MTASSTSPLAVPAGIDRWSANDVVRWSFETHGPVATTVSFEDAALAHLVATTVPGAPITLLDTQYLFAETLWFVDELRRSLDLNLEVLHPQPDVLPDNLWQTDTDACCAVRKVEPLNRALAGKRAWITGLRRVDGPTRAHTPIAAFDVGRNLVKVNPLAAWSDDDLALYVRLHELPANPLTDRGYPSIGCWPCTRPVAPGEDRRTGRWAGQAKTECGLHVPAASAS